MTTPAGRRLLAVTVALALTPTARATTDHLECVRVHDAVALRALADVSAPALGLTSSCRLSPAAELCLPADVAAHDAVDTSTRPPTPLTPTDTGAPPASAYLCYRAKCGPMAGQTGATDPFGRQTLTIRRTTRICTPVSLPTTTTTTTTTLGPSPACGLAGAPACDGACGGQSACVQSSSGYCWCVQSAPTPVPCGGVAGAPQCWGTCPDATPLCLDVGGTCQCGGGPTTTAPTTLCPTTTTTTLPPPCGGQAPACFGVCANGLGCVANAQNVCACEGAPVACGSPGLACGGRDCPAGQACGLTTVFPFGPQCPGIQTCACQ
jgi:hypothetical protein